MNHSTIVYLESYVGRPNHITFVINSRIELITVHQYKTKPDHIQYGRVLFSLAKVLINSPGEIIGKRGK